MFFHVSFHVLQGVIDHLNFVSAITYTIYPNLVGQQGLGEPFLGCLISVMQGTMSLLLCIWYSVNCTCSFGIIFEWYLTHLSYPIFETLCGGSAGPFAVGKMSVVSVVDIGVVMTTP